ncbi:Hypothetical predicted protein [Octopus vulgaris]|uniref:Uncharacterized protein n=1 Tax=Octopus vulgaris TaxID=6645 RepID=A0AA36B4V5_OCTVU|nr:Hypothetical predicted protein [Octopus vulgaris]
MSLVILVLAISAVTRNVANVAITTVTRYVVALDVAIATVTRNVVLMVVITFVIQNVFLVAITTTVKSDGRISDSHAVNYISLEKFEPITESFLSSDSVVSIHSLHLPSSYILYNTLLDYTIMI